MTYGDLVSSLFLVIGIGYIVTVTIQTIKEVKSMKKYARVKYYKFYAPFGEGYAIEIYYNNEWELDRFFSLQHCIIDKPEDEKNFVHFGIINKIRELVSLGYVISWG